MHSVLTINSFLKGSEIIKHIPPKEGTEEPQTILGESRQLDRTVLCEQQPFQNKKFRSIYMHAFA